MTNSLKIELPLPPPRLHPNHRSGARNYTAALVRQARGHAYLAAVDVINRLRLETPVFERCEIIPIFRLTRRQDDDNLRNWLKPYADGLQDAGIVANDSTAVILEAEQITGRANTRSLGVTLNIRERQG